MKKEKKRERKKEEKNNNFSAQAFIFIFYKCTKSTDMK